MRDIVRLCVAALLAAQTLGCVHLPQAAASDVRVLVYNIHAGWDPHGEANLERVAALIREVGADVVLLQEVDRHTTRSGHVDQIGRLAAATGMHSAFGRTLDYQGGEYGIAILSRWVVVRDTLIPLPVQPAQERAGGSYEPRGVLHVVLRWPGGDVHVLNTHLDPSRDDHYRMQEMRTVANVAGAARLQGRVLLGGDLNAEPGTAVVAYITGQGWRDAFALCGDGDGLTYPWDTPVKRIDYLLLSNGWSCREARVLDSDASDHRPVFFRLTATSP